MSSATCSSSRTALSVAMGIPSRSKTALSGLPKRRMRTRGVSTVAECPSRAARTIERGQLDPPRSHLPTSKRSLHTDATWTFFFNPSCGSGTKRSKPVISSHTSTLQPYPHSHQQRPHQAAHRSFSVQSCVDKSTPAFVSQGMWSCSHKESLTPQSIIGPPSCIVVDNAHRGKKSSSIAQWRSKNNSTSSPRQHSPLPEQLHPSRPGSDRSIRLSKVGLASPSAPFMWECKCTLPDRSSQRRFLHSTRSRRFNGDQEGTRGTNLTVDQKRATVAQLRQRALVKSSVSELWASYTRIAQAEAVAFLQSDDVAVVFQVLAKSDQSEEAMEMMLQVAVDVNDLGKQLPQEAFEILMNQAIDHMPAQQIKAAIWQIQGRRRFITEFTQLCESNAEMKRFLGLYSQLNKSSFDVDGFSTYFKNRKERAEGLGKAVDQWIKDEGTHINPKVLEGLLVFLLDRDLLDLVHGTIGRVSKQGFHFSPSFYTTAIHRFGRAQKFDYMELTLERMRRQGLEPSVETYSAMIDAHSKAGNLREAQRAYQDILAAGQVPIEQTFGPMLEAVGKMGDFDMIKQLVDQMNSSGVPSNEYTFSALLQSLSHDAKKSAELFVEMARQIQPNTINFNLLIRTFQRHGDLDGAFKVFRTMVTDSVKPDRYTFSSILSMFAARGDTEGAEDFWDEMVTVHRVNPNVHAYGSMMHVYCTAEDMLSAQAVYREMIQANILPNEVIFGTLLNAYARQGDLTQMLSIYDAMRTEGLKANSFIYANLLFGLVTHGDMSAAQRLFENMEEDGFGNNVLAQTILMKGYLDQGNTKESIEVYKRMVRGGLVPNFMTYAALINAYAKRGEIDAGRRFLNKIMNSRGLVVMGGDEEEPQEEDFAGLDINQGQDRASPSPDMTMEKPSMAARFREGHLSSIGTERQSLKSASVPQPLMAFTPLLNAYAKESNLLAANGLFEEIKSRGLEPNTVTYTIVMDAYRRAGDVDSVLRIWDQIFGRFRSQWKSASAAHQKGDRPSKKVAVEWIQDRLSTKASKLQRLLQRPVSITLDSLCYSGRIQEARETWKELESMGFEFDSSNWNDYCIALARNGLLLDACKIVQEKLLPGYVGDSNKEGSKSLTSMNFLPSEELSARTKRTMQLTTTFGQGSPVTSPSDSASSLSETPLESILPPEGAVSSKRPMTLLYPRPKTFAALADSLEELLMRDQDKRARVKDYLLDPLVGDINSTGRPLSKGTAQSEKEAAGLHTRKMEKQQRLVEAKLKTYPHPYEGLQENDRKVLWTLVRAAYPQVLEVLGEGMLVAAGSMNTPGPFGSSGGEGPSRDNDEDEDDEKEEVRARRKRDQPTEVDSGFCGFRQWRRLKAVMKDAERRRFLEERESMTSPTMKRSSLADRKL